MAHRSVKINPREKVFVDTAAFIGILADKDENHKSAIEVMSDLRAKKARLFTTEAVLFELANALSAIEFRARAVSFIDTLRKLSSFEIVPTNAELFENALRLYRERPDKDWSLTDCASFVVMREREISVAFTSDKHFKQAGFVKLLEK